MLEKWLGSAIGLAAAFALPAGAFAQETYPSRQVRIVVPFAAGGAVDATARIVGAKLQERLGQPVIIENKPGVGGNLAADFVAKSDARRLHDPADHDRPGDEPVALQVAALQHEKDLTPVTQLVETGLLLVATPKLAAKTCKGLVALAKAKPGVLNYGNTGVGNPLHLAMEMLMRDTGMKIQAVPFRGDAPLNTALISGDIQVAVVPVATALGTDRGQADQGAGGDDAAARMQGCPICRRSPSRACRDFAAESWQGLFVAVGHAARRSSSGSTRRRSGDERRAGCRTHDAGSAPKSWRARRPCSRPSSRPMSPSMRRS